MRKLIDSKTRYRATK